MASEQDILRMERRVPDYAGRATRRAYQAALSAGRPVLVVKDGEVVEVRRVEGRLTRRVVKKVPAPVPAPKGRPWKLP